MNGYSLFYQVKVGDKLGLLIDRVDPRIALGGIDNRYGMLGMVQRGIVAIDDDTMPQNVMQTFGPKSMFHLEGKPVLCIPAPNGQYFPLLLLLPKINEQEINFIIEGWKAFTEGVINEELIQAIYNATGKQFIFTDATGKQFTTTPDIVVLTSYIEQYLVSMNSKKLEKIVDAGKAIFNITEKGELSLQLKRNDGEYISYFIKPGENIPENFKKDLQYLRTSIKFTDRNFKKLAGINSKNTIGFITLKDNEIIINNMTYNEYIMSRAKTYLEKGIESKNSNNDWVYFANPVIKMTFGEQEEIIEDNSEKVEEETNINIDSFENTSSLDDLDDPFAAFDQLDAAKNASEETIEEAKERCRVSKDVLGLD